MNTKLIGRWGEAQAAQYLKNKGYKIIGADYRTRFGEIDIIAQHRGFLVFVEVKTRKDDTFAQAREYVNKSKQSRLISAAMSWIQSYGETGQPRFDVIEVYYCLTDGKPNVFEIQHIRSAFDTSR